MQAQQIPGWMKMWRLVQGRLMCEDQGQEQWEGWVSLHLHLLLPLPAAAALAWACPTERWVAPGAQRQTLTRTSSWQLLLQQQQGAPAWLQRRQVVQCGAAAWLAEPAVAWQQGVVAAGVGPCPPLAPAPVAACPCQCYSEQQWQQLWLQRPPAALLLHQRVRRLQVQLGG